MTSTIAKTLSIAALAVAAMLGAAGAAHGDPAATPAERTRILGTVWELDGNPGVHVTFTREGEYGNFGCNAARGDMRLKKKTKDSGTYRSKPWATTRKLCPPEIMTVEAHVQKVLSGNGTWVRSGATLTISNDTGTVRFKARTPAS